MTTVLVSVAVVATWLMFFSLMDLHTARVKKLEERALEYSTAQAQANLERAVNHPPALTRPNPAREPELR